MDLKAEAEALGIKVDARWSGDTLRQKIEAAKPAAPAEPVKMLRVRLLKNYSPVDGMPVRVIGEPAPPPYYGVGFKNKLWAGTVIDLPFEEARRLIENAHVATEYVIDSEGHRVLDPATHAPLTRPVKRRVPLAERADDYTFTDGQQDAASAGA